MDGNYSRCALSMCDTTDGYCETKISDGELATLNFIILLPIVLIVVLPLVAARCKFEDDDVHVRRTAEGDGSDARLTSVARSGVDPPMFLCGVGLLPLECGVSGLLTIVSIMISVFVVIFYLMLLDDRPCTTGLGRCRTISCICGNVYEEGALLI